MATAAERLTVAQFEKQYSHEKPYFEFWQGEAVQKSMPTWLHGLIQRILMELLSGAGYKAASEVKLKIDPDFQPVPDVIATRGRIDSLYPTIPLEIVIEILSADDAMSRVLRKCRAYQNWGFADTYVVDPEARIVFLWKDHCLEEVNTFASLPVSHIWTKLDEQLAES